ncbi:hypothetical protein [Neobacillus cucumis]|uniref:Transcriptional regulator n=1 Tax=Neobacillus cucumis TaxID=1740721 RepID=A0A2N5HII3_9BACI|nr:hypothetical protein [Neobacillus cucumis]PLS05313.1 hypothetical protein CVD27_09950 [Neobacillus cucumis]
MIKLHVFIIGPEPLVNKISKIAMEFNELKTKSIIYEKVEESAILVREHQEPKDIFIFAGPTPFFISKKDLPLNVISYYIPFKGSDIYRTLLEIYEKYHHYPIISFDIIEPHSIEEIYEEMGISRIPYELITFKEVPVDSDELANYHIKLFKQGKVHVVATTLNSVYERLKLLNVPVFLMKHTNANIRDTLCKAMLSGQNQKKEEAQFTVLQFQMIYEERERNEQLSKDCHLIKQKIVEFGNLLFSSTNLSDSGIITLYTTRGVFEKVTKRRRDFTFLKEMNERITVNLGIGYADTAESAAYNARNALEFSIREKRGSSFLIDAEKRIYGPLGTGETVNYPLKKSNDNKQNSLTLRKFFAWLSMIQKKEITTREISIGMNTSERHAARILKSLCENNIARIIGKETMNQKGRPRIVYEIDYTKLAKLVNEKEEQRMDPYLLKP